MGPSIALVVGRMVLLLVEDNVDLAKSVELAFRAFGFLGEVLHSETVTRTEELLERESEIDIVLTDMNLPDGTGLDVIRLVRRHPRWRYTPVLICSGEPTPDKVARAYALGANIFVPKGARGRSLVALMRALHDHWLKDAVLPDPSRAPEDVAARLIDNRRRTAEIYVRLAGLFPDDADFWLLRALGQSNHANLIQFLVNQLGPDLRRFANPEFEAAQEDDAIRLHDVENRIDHREVVTVDDACNCLLELVPLEHSEARIRLVSSLFPNARVAMTKLVEAITQQLDEIAAWLDMHSRTPRVRDGAGEIRALAARLRPLVA